MLEAIGGRPLFALILLHKGRIAVRAENGKLLATLKAGDFAGEIRFLEMLEGADREEIYGKANKVSIEAEEDCEFLEFDAAQLHRYLKDNKEVRHGLEVSFIHGLCAKLHKDNEKMAAGEKPRSLLGKIQGLRSYLAY